MHERIENNVPELSKYNQEKLYHCFLAYFGIFCSFSVDCRAILSFITSKFCLPRKIRKKWEKSVKKFCLFEEIVSCYQNVCLNGQKLLVNSQILAKLEKLNVILLFGCQDIWIFGYWNYGFDGIKNLLNLMPLKGCNMVNGGISKNNLLFVGLLGN